MYRHWLAGVTVVCLLIAGGESRRAALLADGAAAPQQDPRAQLLRVFLKDGTSIVSFGEFARLDGRVVFSMPTGGAADRPDLHLVDLADDRVDWERTTGYAESARARHYLETRAEADFALLSGDIAQALNDIGLTNDPRQRLSIVQRARRTLAEWPPAHHNYKQAEVRQMLTTLDEAIAELRAATGGDRFDVTLVTSMAPPPALVPLLPPPTVQQLIEQTLAVARIAEVPAERSSLLSVALAAIDRHAAELPTEWATTTRATAVSALTREITLDRRYRELSTEMMNLATARARVADVRGVERLMALIDRRDEVLGRARPDVVSATVIAIQDRLEGARRLRLERDRWALRLPMLREYRSSMGSSLARLESITPALQDIKALSGSGPDAIGAIIRSCAAIQRLAALIAPPEEMQGPHALLLSAIQMADSAARIRREAALTGDLDRAWNASSAAAGALMLTTRATSEMQSALRVPQLPR